MEIFSSIILISSILSLGMGIIVLLSNPSKKLNRIFAVFSLVASLFIFVNFILSVAELSVFWTKATYSLAPILFISFAFWIFELCNKKIGKIESASLIVSGIFFSVSPYFGTFFLNNSIAEYLNDVKSTGPLFPLYAAYLIFIAARLVSVLLASYRKSEKLIKNQIIYVLIGTVSSGTIGIAVSALLPMFGINNFSFLDSPGMLFLLFFTALAVTRYHLFELKIILTEIMVAIMGIVLLFLLFLMPTSGLKLLLFIFFCLFFPFGYYLIKTTHEEFKGKQEAERLAAELKILNQNLEKKVEERTKTLEDRNKELETFYQLTIGRELRMAELKEKIKGIEEEKK